MAYLPPAGKRCMTDSRLSYLPTMAEIVNLLYTEKMLAAIRKPQKKTDNQIPPLKKANSDQIGFRPARKHTELYAETPPMRPFCLGTPSYYYTTHDVRARCGATKLDPCDLPYGLPPDTFDVRIRTNWFDYWKEDNFRYTGAFQKWEDRYGEKYFYPASKSTRTKR